MIQGRTHRATTYIAMGLTLGLAGLSFAAACQTREKKTEDRRQKTEDTASVTNHQPPLTSQPTAAVRSLLEAKCLGCHGVGNKLAGLDLRTREAALKGGGRGAALVSGKSDKSLLMQLVNGSRAPLMPPTGKLPATEIALLKRWIDAGAAWPTTAMSSAKPQVWWSFQAPKMPPVPSLHSAWIRNPIDAFVHAKLQENGLKPSPPASHRALIRRAYFDLIGLPPTPAQVEAFINDTSPNAWEKVVDGLLASPRYGERWGRHWAGLGAVC